MTALAGKSIVITGAGRGLGAAYARLAARQGAAVVVNDLDPAAVQDTCAQIAAAGGRALALPGDVADWDFGEALTRTCIDTFGRIDGLINNAGIFHMARPEDETRERIDAILRVNVAGTVVCGLPALKAMRAQGHGAILNVTSGAHSGMAGMSIYGATKGAVASLTYGWAADVAGTGVRVNAISPIARTQMFDIMLGHGDPRQQQTGTDVHPDQNAAVAIYLVSDLAAGINGQIVRIDPPRLSLGTHPGTLAPAASRDDWTLDAVAKVFDADFRHRLQPLGVHPAPGVTGNGG